ncbi:PspA/IM30 family protein [Paenibacillus sp. FSL W8-0426]|uniref:PspA/IM30 family protein n=1 Tax=Paenibacillus sp. FSL W8-0426 TaxID=2921714 RepID=UPI0030DC48E2
MGVWTRFRDVMKANVNHLLERADDPEKVVDACMRSMNSDLGQVKAETAGVLAEESRAKRAVDECAAEIRKLQRYAEKSVQDGDEDRARGFLEKKAKLAGKMGELQAAHERASAKAKMMKHMQDKLVSDLNRLESRHAELKGKMADARAQQQANERNAALRSADAAFKAMEEKANQALNEATALAELRAEAQGDDLDELIAQLEREMNAEPRGGNEALTTEEELRALQEQQRK